MKTKIENRDVMPQWGGGKGNNLGEFTLPTVAFTGEGLRDAMRDDVVAEAVADKLNCQLHITFGSKLCRELVIPYLDKQDKDEKQTEWLDRTVVDAKKVAASKLPGSQLDYVAAFMQWATVEFPKRGQRAERKPVLANYDAVVAGVEAKWSGMSDERKLAVLTAVKLSEDLVVETAERVVQAIAAKYQRPIAVDVDAMFE